MTTSTFGLTLKHILLIDAAACTAMGVLLALGSGWLARLLELPTPLLLYAGLVLFPIAGFMAYVATRQPIPRPDAWCVVLGNAAWVAGSLWLLLSGWVAPNALGIAFVAAQAAVVAGLAFVEQRALAASASGRGVDSTAA